jgi:hypothetical protein
VNRETIAHFSKKVEAYAVGIHDEFVSVNPLRNREARLDEKGLSSPRSRPIVTQLNRLTTARGITGTTKPSTRTTG